MAAELYLKKYLRAPTIPLTIQTAPANPPAKYYGRPPLIDIQKVENKRVRILVKVEELVAALTA
jgi:hypothetical protein